jgi:hypothetical protein
MSVVSALRQDVLNVEHMFEKLYDMLLVHTNWHIQSGTPHLLDAVILQYNQALPYDKNGVLFLPTSGASIYKIDSLQATIIATLLKTAIAKTKKPIEFYLAAIQQESCFSPKAFNPNHQHDPTTWQNRTPEENFEMTDWGLCQFSGSQLPSFFPALKAPFSSADLASMQTFVENPAWVINRMVDKYETLYILGESLAPVFHDIIEIQVEKSSKKLNSLDETAMFIAWLAYNAGATGAQKQLQAALNSGTTLGAHPFHCLTWYRQFQELNITC